MDFAGFLSFLQANPVWQYYISAMLVMAPAVQIFRRAGFRPYFALFLLVPWVGHICCIVLLALKRWPRAEVKT